MCCGIIIFITSKVQTEFEEWVEGGCKKAEDLIKESEKED